MKRFPRKRDGDPLTPRDWNELVAEVERQGKLRVTGADSFSDGPDGPRIVFRASTTGAVKKAITTLTIPAISGGTMQIGALQLYDGFGPYLSYAGTVYAYNPWAEAVAGTTSCVIGWDGGRWLILGWDC